jgi:putative transposase
MKTIKYRIKDSTTKKLLTKMKLEVNWIWYHINQQIAKNWKESRKYTNRNDIHVLTKGLSKETNLNQQTIQAVGHELILRTQKAKKKIRNRKATNLGWVPFNGQTIKLIDDKVMYDKKVFKIWKSRELCGKIKMGSFTEDARGNWYVNFVCEDDTVYERSENNDLGIDLGLISTATGSDGEKLTNREYRKLEKKLAKAQRANKNKQAKNIHAKIKNCRKDNIEKYTSKISKQNNFIVIGNVSAKKLTKTKMAKSVLDNGWGMLKSKISYKVERHGGMMIEVNEAYTSRTCSDCSTGWVLPRGLKSLAVREYTCPCCGVVQDRDINAARNILRIGRDTLKRNRLPLGG